MLSHHLGDLDHAAAFLAFVEGVGHYERLFGVRPAVIAHDLHPDYASTRYALGRAGPGVRLVAVQHHHAHLASCMAENGLDEPVLGVIFDGTGYGTDGTVWGGEFLLGGLPGVPAGRPPAAGADAGRRGGGPPACAAYHTYGRSGPAVRVRLGTPAGVR